jgi:hypothetical protein
VSLNLRSLLLLRSEITVIKLQNAHVIRAIKNGADDPLTKKLMMQDESNINKETSQTSHLEMAACPSEWNESESSTFKMDKHRPHCLLGDQRPSATPAASHMLAFAIAARPSGHDAVTTPTCMMSSKSMTLREHASLESAALTM